MEAYSPDLLRDVNHTEFKQDFFFYFSEVNICIRYCAKFVSESHQRGCLVMYSKLSALG